ncbi:hypothetical protein [Metamycoplasma hominis]|nr:hypothetical protein [Metamycoplasma hominis]
MKASTWISKSVSGIYWWHHLLLGEFENPDDKHSTLAIYLQWKV